MILTIGPGGCGFTFLNWTISFLRGDASYQTLDEKQHQIEFNPLLDETAHRYNKDHIWSNDAIESLNSATDNSIIYMVPNSHSDFEYLLSLTGKKIIFDASKNSKMSFARLMMCIPKEINPYFELIDYLNTTYHPDLVKEVLLDCHKFFVQYYQLPKKSTTLYLVDYDDIFKNLDNILPDLFEYLELAIDQARLKLWQEIYNQYRTQNQKDFCAEFLPMPSENNTQKKKILIEVLKWKNGSSLNT
jgi:hypothetical protein